MLLGLVYYPERWLNDTKTRRLNPELREFSHWIQEIIPSWGGAEGFPQSHLKVSHQHDVWIYTL
jgi:hypothetical protein